MWDRIRSAAQAAVEYVRDNPDELVRAVVNARGLRFGLPLAALRWAVAQAPQGGRAPKDVEVGSSPPALRLSATVDAMGTPVRATAAIHIVDVTLTADAIRLGIRLFDVKLNVEGEATSPVATLIKSGALDLSKPGNLVKFLPKRPPAIVDAEGDRIVVDLMMVPKLADNRRLRRLLAVVTPMLGVRSVETDRDHIWIQLQASPRGFRKALGAFRGEI